MLTQKTVRLTKPSNRDGSLEPRTFLPKQQKVIHIILQPRALPNRSRDDTRKHGELTLN